MSKKAFPLIVPRDGMRLVIVLDVTRMVGSCCAASMVWTRMGCISRQDLVS